jgi:sphinganine C4-monooxygenase
MVPWEGYASDETMGTFAPILLYWVYAGGYQLVLHRRPLQRYRLHTTAEEEEKNLVTLPAVVRGVLLQQLVQAIVAMILFMVSLTVKVGSVSLPVHIAALISLCYFSDARCHGKKKPR